MKIDKVFVSDMETSKDDLLLVQSIIEMAHSLDRQVVAEGVETEEILRMLKVLGCDQAQGYFISRPIRIDELLPMIGTDEVKIYS